MSPDTFFAINTLEQPWEERFNERIGKALFRKNLYTDPASGAEIRLVRYPAGIINPRHTHPCGHGMYVLEGTEVAEWLNEIGITGIVLKYRVPFRNPENRSQAAVQDAQRTMSLVRGNASEWGLDPKRIGILGFSAGGQVAGLVSIFEQRQYEPLDDVDKVSSRPDFAVLVYPGGLDERGQVKLRDEVKVTKGTPPMFFVHAFDDGVSVFNTLLLATELKKVGVTAEVHVYATGGHGYGMRHVDGQPVTDWPKPCEAWLKTMSFIK